MKTLMILFLVTLIPSILTAQKENNNKNIKEYYDFSVTIDIKEQLFTNDFKLIINPSNKRNYLVRCNYKYDNSLMPQNREGEGLIRIPIDTTEYLITFNQLDTILNLTKDLFKIDYIPQKHNPLKFYPPRIYDGAIPIVTLEINTGNIFQIELTDQDNISYTRLLKYILKIINAP